MARKDKKKKGKHPATEEKDKKTTVTAVDGQVIAPNGDLLNTDKDQVEFSQTSGESKVNDEEEETDDEETDEEEETVSGEDKKKTKKPTAQIDELSSQVASLSTMMSEALTAMTAIARRVERMETGGANEFRYHQKPEDVAKAAEGRQGIDERIIKIVDTTLGEDFGVKLERIDENSLGLLFTLEVPQRLSDIKEDFRPVMDRTTGQQMIDDKKQPVSEKYWPGDRRSRAVPTGSSFDLIREQCERVRAYIVATYQKSNRPTPEFKIKQ